MASFINRFGLRITNVLIYSNYSHHEDTLTTINYACRLNKLSPHRGARHIPLSSTLSIDILTTLNYRSRQSRSYISRISPSRYPTTHAKLTNRLRRSILSREPSCKPSLLSLYQLSFISSSCHCILSVVYSRTLLR